MDDCTVAYTHTECSVVRARARSWTCVYGFSTRMPNCPVAVQPPELMSVYCTTALCTTFDTALFSTLVRTIPSFDANVSMEHVRYFSPAHQPNRHSFVILLWHQLCSIQWWLKCECSTMHPTCVAQFQTISIRRTRGMLYIWHATICTMNGHATIWCILIFNFIYFLFH